MQRAKLIKRMRETLRYPGWGRKETRHLHVPAGCIDKIRRPSAPPGFFSVRQMNRLASTRLFALGRAREEDTLQMRGGSRAFQHSILVGTSRRSHEHKPKWRSPGGPRPGCHPSLRRNVAPGRAAARACRAEPRRSPQRGFACQLRSPLDVDGARPARAVSSLLAARKHGRCLLGHRRSAVRHSSNAARREGRDLSHSVPGPLMSPDQTESRIAGC